MVMFDNIEELFQNLRDFNDCSKALVTLATATGTLFIIYHFIKLGWQSILGFRLYVLSQFCCRTDFKKKYGQWACISGATDGIGLAMAKELAKRGHSIIVIGRNEEKLARVKSELEEELCVGEVVTVKIDLSDSSEENFERIKSQIDFDNRDIGILINNAGYFPSELKRFAKFELDEIRSIVNLNILAVLYLTKMALPGMVARGKGLILNVSSTLSFFTGPYINVYGATKTFMNRFSEQLQDEYSSHPVDIINLTPGSVHTKLFTDVSKFSKPTMLFPTPDEYARTTLNAVSTGISQISGTAIHGFTIRVIEFFHIFNLVTPLYKLAFRLTARNVKLSPVIKRKNQSNQAANEENTELNRT